MKPLQEIFLKVTFRLSQKKLLKAHAIDYFLLFREAMINTIVLMFMIAVGDPSTCCRALINSICMYSV